MTQDELQSLKRALYSWAKKNLRGLSVVNELTGNKIEISALGGRRIYYHHYLAE